MHSCIAPMSSRTGRPPPLRRASTSTRARSSTARSTSRPSPCPASLAAAAGPCCTTSARRGARPLAGVAWGRAGRRGRARNTRGKGAFDPPDTTRVKHTRIGVWDLYEQVDNDFDYVPGSSWLERAFEAYECLPYLLRMISDILSIRSCWLILLSYGVTEVLSSLIPAASLW